MSQQCFIGEEPFFNGRHDEQLAGAEPLSRLHLTQERMDLEQELVAAGGDDGDLEELEAALIEVAAAYGAKRADV